MPKAVTVCSRVMHYTYMNPVVSSYAFGWFFGSLRPVCLYSSSQAFTIIMIAIFIITNVTVMIVSSLF